MCLLPGHYVEQSPFIPPICLNPHLHELCFWGEIYLFIYFYSDLSQSAPQSFSAATLSHPQPSALLSVSVSTPYSLLPGHVLSSISPDLPSSSCPPDALGLSLFSPSTRLFPLLISPAVTWPTTLTPHLQSLNSYTGPEPLFLCQIFVVVMLLFVSALKLLFLVTWACTISAPVCLSGLTFPYLIPATMWI